MERYGPVRKYPIGEMFEIKTKGGQTGKALIHEWLDSKKYPIYGVNVAGEEKLMAEGAIDGKLDRHEWQLIEEDNTNSPQEQSNIGQRSE